MKNIKLYNILGLILAGTVLFSTAHPIYEHLIHCYRGNETEPYFPNTLQLFIELIRKIEDAYPTAHDIRTLSAIILHRLRIDGIEKAPGIRESDFVTPYRAKGIMGPKFQLLLQMVSNTANSIDLEKALNPTEICMLHRLISISVEPYERGDEERVCPIAMMPGNNYSPRPSPRHKNHNHGNETFTRQFSRCPLEKGTIRSIDYGTFAPGVIIASIAAGLQPQNVRISEYISLQHKRTPWDNLESMTKRDTEKELNKLLRSIDSMDNAYSAGLAGDLAEICVYQGPYFNRNTSIGMAGSWDDLYLPRLRYLRQAQHPHRWEMTDSEILAGIDGLFMSQQISSWVHHLRRMRLSQIVDMYYSARGIPILAIESTNNMPPIHLAGKGGTWKPSSFSYHQRLNIHSERIDSAEDPIKHGTPSFNSESNSKLRAIFDHSDWEWKSSSAQANVLSRFSISDGINKACNRKEILEVIDRDKLKDETYFLSQVLQLSTSSMAISDEDLRANCDATVDRFFNYSVILLDTLPKCNDISDKYIKPVVDTILITDGARNESDNLKLISFIAEVSDISSYGSALSIIHGSTGDTIVNRTHSIADVFEQLRNYTGNSPVEVSISTAMKTAHAILTNQTEREQRNGIIVRPAQVILLVSQGQRSTQADFDSAKLLIDGSFRRFPDVYFIFLTNNRQTFDDLMRDRWPKNTRWKDRQYRIITTDAVDIGSFEKQIHDAFDAIPRRIIAQVATSRNEARSNPWDEVKHKNYFEDYISPDQEIKYRIHPQYFYDSEGISIEFQGVGYGSLSVCMSRQSNFVPSTCKMVADFDMAWFNITDTCRSSYVNTRLCQPVFFKVRMDSSLVKCAESDCRYPDQVRFVIRHYGLLYTANSDSRRGHASSLAMILSLLFIREFIVFYN